MLVLASASEARAALLRAEGFRFKILPARVRELAGRGRTLRETVLENARRKAAAVARRVPRDATILAADTMIEFEGRLHGKPRSRRAAVELLSRLAGRTHRLATGIVVRRGGRNVERCVTSRVTLRALDRAALSRVIARRDPTKYAGGYAVHRNDPLVARIEGSFTNVVGLPMEVVGPLLRRAAEQSS